MTDPVVFPNSFVDGWSGREVIAGYNGEPRIKCVAGGNFQIGAGSASATLWGVGTTVNTFSAFGGASPRPVTADGFDIFGWSPPPVILAPGGSWPPSWWPSVQSQSDDFQPGIPVVIPPWAETGPDPIDPEDLGAVTTTHEAPLGETTDTPPRRGGLLRRRTKK